MAKITRIKASDGSSSKKKEAPTTPPTPKEKVVTEDKNLNPNNPQDEIGIEEIAEAEVLAEEKPAKAAKKPAKKADKAQKEEMKITALNSLIYYVEHDHEWPRPEE